MSAGNIIDPHRSLNVNVQTKYQFQPKYKTMFINKQEIYINLLVQSNFVHLAQILQIVANSYNNMT